MEDSRSSRYGIVEKPDFRVIASIENDQVYLVEQYRYPVGARFWELPQGSPGRKLGQPDLVRAELREKTGMIGR